MPVSTVMRNFAAATTLAGGVALGKLDKWTIVKKVLSARQCFLKVVFMFNIHAVEWTRLYHLKL